MRPVPQFLRCAPMERTAGLAADIAAAAANGGAQAAAAAFDDNLDRVVRMGIDNCYLVFFPV